MQVLKQNKNLIKFIKNEFGVGAIGQALLVTGLMGTMAVTYNVLTQNQSKTVKSLQQDIEMDALTMEITTLLEDDTACLNTFTGMDPTGSGVITTAIKGKDNTDRFLVASGSPLSPTYGNGTITISEIRLGGDAFGKAGWTESSPGSYQGDAYLNILFRRQGKTEGSVSVKRQIKISATLDNPTNVVIACRAEFEAGSTSGTGGVWQTVGSDIYYDTDFVGIGTDNPSFALTIAGGPLSNSSGGIKFPDGTSQSAAGYWTYHTSTAVTYDGGNVGIDVSNPSVRLEVGRQFANNTASIKVGDFYVHSITSLALFSVNAVYEWPTATWSIPDATRRSSTLNMNKTTGEIAFCQTSTVGQADWTCPAYIASDGTVVGSGAGGSGTCSVVSYTNPVSTNSASVSCPGGTWVTGGGGNPNSSKVSGLYPSSATQWTMTTTTGKSSHVVYAICCD